MIRRARVELAANLLLDGRHQARKIVSVAFDCGFRSVSAFYEALRDHYGMHPSELRASAIRHDAD